MLRIFVNDKTLHPSEVNAILPGNAFTSEKRWVTCFSLILLILLIASYSRFIRDGHETYYLCLNK